MSSGTAQRSTLIDMQVPVIEISDLHKAYGSLEVLKGVSLSAPKGHVISLIGSSGSGKSTLLRCCNLLEDSQQGEIRFKGEPIVTETLEPFEIKPGRWIVDAFIVLPESAEEGVYALELRFISNASEIEIDESVTFGVDAG